MWRVLGTCGGSVEEFVKGASDVAGHGDVDETERVAPGEGETAVKCACPISGDGVQ